MKLYFAFAAVAVAREVNENGEKGAFDGSCTNNNNCVITGRDDDTVQVGPSGVCYCDEACHTTFDDCCHDMKYQCYNGQQDTLCPSDKCYKQNSMWMHGENTNITCDMDNDECLATTCALGKMTVRLDTELFHANDFIEGKFITLLQSGERTLKMGNAVLGNGDWTADGDVIVVEVNYATAGITPTMSTDANNDKWIHYGISFSSMGNDDDDSDEIEFFVDHTINAECKYPARIDVEADGFWVNQEDVSMNINGDGELKKQFDCKFYAESDRDNQIKAHNIVNMGEMLYATLESSPLHGLGYELTKVEVSDPKDGNNLYDVTAAANQATVNYSVTPADAKAATGTNIDFEYLSFGFESYGGGGNQNEVNVKCFVDLYILE